MLTRETSTSGEADSTARQLRQGAQAPASPAERNVNVSGARSLQKTMPASDPAYPIIEGILGVVPASRWAFARFGPDGALASLFCSDANGTDRERLNDEFKRQRTKVPTGPRISAMLGPLEDFASGVALLFADAHTNYGILTLLRTAEFGPFMSSEIGMLTFALDALSDRLSALRLHPSSAQFASCPKSGRMEPTQGAFYVLDSDLQIVLAPSGQDQRRMALTGLRTQIAAHLPFVLENAVRELTRAWSGDSVHDAGVASPVPFLVVRTEPLSGPAGLFIGVHIDRYRSTNSLLGATSRFRISPRELQVLALLLDGNQLDKIAKALNITSSTVQDHIKSMLTKTQSSNRTELIARVLGWESAPKANDA